MAQYFGQTQMSKAPNALDYLKKKEQEKKKFNLFDFSDVTPKPQLNFGPGVSGHGITNFQDFKANIPQQAPQTQPTQKSRFSLIPKASANFDIQQQAMSDIQAGMPIEEFETYYPELYGMKQVFTEYANDIKAGMPQEEASKYYPELFGQTQPTQEKENLPGFDLGVKVSQGIANIGKGLKFEAGNELVNSKNPFVSSFGNMLEAFKFAGNIPGDAIQLAGELGQMIADPIGTVKDLDTLGKGIIEAGLNKVFGTDIYTSEDKREMVKGVTQALKDNFGTLEKAKNTIIENPTDVLLTIQGGLQTAKLGIKNPNTIAKLDQINEAISPINILRTEIGAVKGAGKGLVKGTGELGAQVLGKTTGTSAETIKTAFKQGGTKEFGQSLKGETSPQDILGGVKQGLEEIKMNKNKLYGEGAKILQANKKQIPLNNIQKDLLDTITTDYKVKVLDDGTLDFSQSKITGNTSKSNIQSMYDDLINWKDKTPDGLDTLKQRIQDYYRGVDDSGKSDRLSTILSNKIKDKIIEQVPEYKQMVGNYEKVTNDLRDITKTLSLGKNIQTQTALTKLNSILRENFTARQDVVKLIEQYTGKNIQAQVAGASLNPALAKGLAGVVTGGGIVFGQLANPAFWAGLGLASPRLIGEIAKTVGITSNKMSEFIANIKKYVNPNTNSSLNNLEGNTKKLKPSQKALPPGKIITPQTKDRAIIQESKKGLEKAKIETTKPKPLKKKESKPLIKPNQPTNVSNKAIKKPSETGRKVLKKILPSNFKEKAQDFVEGVAEKTGAKMNLMGNEGIGADKTKLLKSSNDSILKRYSGNSDDFNKPARQGIENDNIKKLDDYISKNKSDLGITYRGINPKEGGVFDNQIKNIKNNGIEDKGFMTSTTNIEDAKIYTGKNKIILEIKNTKGVEIPESISPYGDKGEIILPRGTKLKYIGEKEKDGFRIIETEIIQPTKTKENILENLNPTGGLYVNYTPEIRATAKLGPNITTLDKTMKVSPDTEIIIYRGAPKSQKSINAGDFVTTNYDLAKSYTGEGNILKMKVKAKDILDDITEPLGEEYIYRPQANKQKILKPTNSKQVSKVSDDLISKIYEVPEKWQKKFKENPKEVIANALYNINKEAKKIRDKRTSLKDSMFDYDTGYQTPARHNKLSEMYDEMQGIYDIKDRYLKKIIEKYKLEPKGYHTFYNGDAMDYYEFGGQGFHIPQNKSKIDLGEISGEITSKKAGNYMSLDTAKDILGTLDDIGDIKDINKIPLGFTKIEGNSSAVPKGIQYKDLGNDEIIVRNNDKYKIENSNEYDDFKKYLKEKRDIERNNRLNNIKIQDEIIDNIEKEKVKEIYNQQVIKLKKELKEGEKKADSLIKLINGKKYKYEIGELRYNMSGKKVEEPIKFETLDEAKKYAEYKSGIKNIKEKINYLSKNKKGILNLESEHLNYFSNISKFKSLTDLLQENYWFSREGKLGQLQGSISNLENKIKKAKQIWGYRYNDREMQDMNKELEYLKQIYEQVKKAK